MFLKPIGKIRWIVVFLGNPGKEYECTRHNTGFMTASAMEKKLGVKINRARFDALTVTAEIGEVRVLLMKPLTFMNLSGEAVRQAAGFYKIPPERIIVVSDEMSLPLGKIRIREKGSAGGHNGLKNIISQLGTDAFGRVRIGVGAPPHPDFEVRDWVLGVLRNGDLEVMLDACSRACDAIECYIVSGAAKAMNTYN